MTKVGIRERKKVETRSRILRSAVELFGRNGIDAVSVEDVATHADVGKGTVYNYFAAKEDMLAAFVIELDREALRGFGDLARADTLAEALDAAAWRLLECKSGYHAFVQVFLARALTSPALHRELTEFQALLDAALTDLFDELRERNLVRAGFDCAEFILAFKTMQLGLSSLWAMEGPPYDDARRMTRLLTKALAREIGS
jgi:AcrR family transcriptional regulator